MLKFLQKNYIENNPKSLVIMPWVDENKIKPNTLHIVNFNNNIKQSLKHHETHSKQHHCKSIKNN